MAKTQKAHSHNYDLSINSFNETRATCTICGFSVPLSMLRSRVNLDAITARENATQRLRDELADYDGEGIRTDLRPRVGWDGGL